MADGEVAPSQHKAARHQGAVCVIARLRAHAGAQSELERRLMALANVVRAEEPRCTHYSVLRPMGEPHGFAVHARFADWAAFKAHAETPHMEAALPRLTAELAAPVALEIFLEV